MIKINKKEIKQKLQKSSIEEMVWILICYSMRYAFDKISTKDMDWLEKQYQKELFKRIHLNKNN